MTSPGDANTTPASLTADEHRKLADKMLEESLGGWALKDHVALTAIAHSLAAISKSMPPRKLPGMR